MFVAGMFQTRAIKLSRAATKRRLVRCDDRHNYCDDQI